MNHLGDTNKMVRDTPRTDDEECEMFIGVSVFAPEDMQNAFEFARQLERELNAANERIKRLEEAGDAMAIHAQLGGIPLDHIGWVNAWREAKEAKL